MVLILRSTAIRLTTMMMVAPLLFLGCYLLTQLIPLPPDVLAIISPSTWDAYSETIWVVQPAHWMPLAVHAEATRGALLYVAAVISLSLAVGQFVIDRKRFALFMQQIKLAVAVWSLIALGLSLFIVFLPERYAEWQTLLIECKERLFLWAVCLIPMILADVAVHRPRVTRLPILEQLRDSLNTPSETPHITGIATITLVVACLLAAGNLFLACATLSIILLFSLLNYFARNQKTRMKICCLAVGAAVGFTGLFIWNKWLLEQFSKIFTVSSSVNQGISSWEFAWFGSGLGGIVDIANASIATSCYKPVVANYSGMVELWYGLGGWGLLALSLMIIITMRFARGLLDRRSGRVVRKYYAGTLVSICLFSLLGYYVPSMNWQTVLLGGWVAILITLACQSSRQSHQPAKSSLYRRGLHNVFIALLVGTLVFAIMFFSAQLYVWKLDRDIAFLHTNSPQSGQIDELEMSIEHSIQWMPFLRKNSRLAMLMGQLKSYHGLDEETLHSFESSIILRPLNPETLVSIANVCDRTGNNDVALSLLRSMPVRRFQPDNYFDRMITRMLDDEITTVEQEILKLVFNGCVDRAGKYLSLMILSGLDAETVEQMLPLRPLIWIIYADVLLSFEKETDAEDVYLKAVTMGSLESLGEKLPYKRIAEHFMSTSQDSKALLVVRSAVEAYPDSYETRQLAADVYRRLGHTSYADEEYIRASILGGHPQ
ncbi:MAG: hypothetical protein IH613_04865 [Desulfuromonadales bacterium]|nr:hypothetical protein [Desulfuromonadales bacterium]